MDTNTLATTTPSASALETINGIPVAHPSPVVIEGGETPVRYVVGFLAVMGGLGMITVGFSVFLMIANNWNFLNWME